MTTTCFIHTSSHCELEQSPFWDILNTTLEKEPGTTLIISNGPIPNHPSITFQQLLNQALKIDTSHIDTLNALLFEIHLQNHLAPKELTPLLQTPGFKEKLKELHTYSYTYQWEKSAFYKAYPKTQKDRVHYFWDLKEKIQQAHKTQHQNTESAALYSEIQTNFKRLKSYLSPFKNAFIILKAPLLPYEQKILAPILESIPVSSLFYPLLPDEIPEILESLPQNTHYFQTPPQKKRFELDMISCPNEKEETLWIAKNCKAKLQALPNPKIGIVWPQNRTLQIALLEALKAHELPVQTPLAFKHSPLFHFLDCYLKLLSKPITPSLLNEFVSNPFSGTLQSQGTEISMPPNAINELASDLYISEGKDIWLTKITQAITTLKNTEKTEENTLSIAMKLTQYEQVLAYLTPLFKQIEPIEPIPTFFKTLHSMLHLFKIEKKTNNPTLYQEIFRQLKQLEKTTQNIKTPLTGNALIATLKSKLETLQIPEIKNSMAQIELIPIEDAREKKWDALYLPYCNQGNEWEAWTSNALIPTVLLPQKNRNKVKHLMALNLESPLILSKSEAHPELEDIQTYCTLYHPEKKWTDMPTLNIQTQKEKQTLNPQEAPPIVFQFKKESLQEPLKNSLNQRALSATQLENFQNCQLQYLFRYILKIPPETGLNEEVSANVWGSLVHAILKDFFEKRSQTTAPFHIQEQWMEEITLRHLEKVPSNHFFWNIKKEILLGSDQTPSLLYGILEAETQEVLPLKPFAFEASFTLESPFKLKGSIDVILKDGLNVAVLDYKTGSKLPTAADIKAFRSLQLPIYMLALNDVLFPDDFVIGGIIYQVKDGDTIKKSVLCCTKESKQDVFELGRKRPFIIEDHFFNELKNHLNMLYQKLSSGNFDPTPLEAVKSTRAQTCSYCPYKHHCTYKDRFKGGYG